MTPIYDKDGVVRLLELLERVCREVKGLPEDVKRDLAIGAGCLETDIDELCDMVTQCNEYVEEMSGEGEYIDLDLGTVEHYKSVVDAMDSLSNINDKDQAAIVKGALAGADCFDANIEGLNDLLVDIEKPWFVIHTDERDKLRDVLTTLLGE